MPNKWYVASKPESLQGLVVDEKTGDNIAVTYLTENAPIVAAAPTAISLLAEVLDNLREAVSTGGMTGAEKDIAWRIAEFLDQVNHEEAS